MIKSKRIAFIGAGFMGGALIRGLVESKAVTPRYVIAYDPNDQAIKPLAEDLKIRTAAGNLQAVSDADIVVLAVKPQTLDSVLKIIGKKLGKRKLVISIAAGVKISTLAKRMPIGARIIRAMPNMAASVGQAATALCAGPKVKKDDILMARQIFDAVGESVVVEEELMDAVTGLSGSGPAFVYLFLEAMIDAGVQCGLTRDVATELAGQTLYGASLVTRKSGEHPALLKDMITSPGGTTIAGLASLEGDRFRGAVIKAVEAAKKRSEELGD